MKKCRFTLACLFLLTATSHARHYRAHDIDIAVALTAPPARVIVEPPRGYTRCYMREATWLDGVLVSTHRECIYEESDDSTVWVSGYWGCVRPGRHGQCGRWNWYSDRWIRNRGRDNMHYHDQPRYHDYEHAHRSERINRSHVHEHNTRVNRGEPSAVHGHAAHGR